MNQTTIPVIVSKLQGVLGTHLRERKVLLSNSIGY